MKILDAWKSYLRFRRAQPAQIVTPLPPLRAIAPKPFEPLTREESIVVLLNALHWLKCETWVMLAMPDCPAKQQLKAELRGRDRAMLREYGRLVGEQER